MTATSIEWTDKTWNPVTGCTKVSPGCAHCYAETVAGRFWGQQYPPTVGPESGVVIPRLFTDVRTHADRLNQPLHWKKPARIFVNSMSDLFHEDIPREFIDQVFAVMALAPQHTFQLLTKRPGRMYDYISKVLHRVEVGRIARAAERFQTGGPHTPDWLSNHAYQPAYVISPPLPNVWLGVSVENQHFADERIPLLLQTPAAIRFISAEPLLGPVSFRWAKWDNWNDARGQRRPIVNEHDGLRMLDWVIIGGESGVGARVFNVIWARSIIAECKAAGVPMFLKQLGRDPVDELGSMTAPVPPQRPILNRKGGDPIEWPEDLRIREFPRESARG